MGQHKHNPTAIAAKNGEIKPKKKITRSEYNKMTEKIIKEEMSKLFPFDFLNKYC